MATVTVRPSQAFITVADEAGSVTLTICPIDDVVEHVNQLCPPGVVSAEEHGHIGTWVSSVRRQVGEHYLIETVSDETVGTIILA